MIMDIRYVSVDGSYIEFLLEVICSNLVFGLVATPEAGPARHGVSVGIQSTSLVLNIGGTPV